MKTPQEYIAEFIAGDGVLKNMEQDLVDTKQANLTRKAELRAAIATKRKENGEMRETIKGLKEQIKRNNAKLQKLGGEFSKNPGVVKIVSRITARRWWLTNRAADQRKADASEAAAKEFWDDTMKKKIVNPPEATAI